MHILISTKQSKYRQGRSSIKLRRRSSTSRGISKTRPEEDSTDEFSTMDHCQRDKPSHVRRVSFSQDELIPTIDLVKNESINSDECKVRWYQENDYTRFEKDRILTSFDYKSALNKTHFNEGEHSIRGLENVINNRLRRRLSGEKKDLLAAVKGEETHQKDIGTFPDLNRFRVVSMRHTKPARDRAISFATEDAKQTQGKPKSWLSRKFPFGAPERKVTRHQSMGKDFGRTLRPLVTCQGVAKSQQHLLMSGASGSE